jgi:hypothetical protein
VGLGILFLLAGYELELFRQRASELALVGWLVSAAVAGACSLSEGFQRC